MSHYLSKRGYVLRKDSIKNEELLALKNTLRARPLMDTKFSYLNKTNDTTFPVYIETKNKLYIPKMFGIEKFGNPTSYLDNYIGKKWTSDIPFNGTLYDSQKEPCNLLINSCKEKGGGILSLQTGGGKTVSVLYVLSQLKVKTIVVVNKIPLMNQWISEIQHFLPNAKIGTLQGQQNINIHNKDIVIAMLQSMARIDYPDELFQDFSCVVIDECHNTSSKIFSQVLFKLCCKYTIGLSATPKRADGCEYVFKWHIGDIVYQSHDQRKGKQPIIRYLKIDSSDYKEVAIQNKITGQTQIQFTSMLSELISMNKRNILIIDIIKDLIKNEPNRKILVLSDRRTHLQTINNLLQNNNNLLQNNINLHNTLFTFGLFLGGMKQHELDISRNSQVILATYQAFGEGVSEKELDTLLLITPKKYVGHLKNSTKNESGKLEQIVGRIFRKEHIHRNPLIIDFNDNFSVYKNQSTQRKTFYKEHFPHAIIQNYSINLDDITDNNNCISFIKIKKDKHKQITETTKLTECLTNCIIED